MSDGDTARETVGPDSHRDPEAWCSRTGTLQDRTAEAWCSRKGILQARTAEAWCSRTGTLQARTAEAWCSRTGTLQARTAEAWCSWTGTLQARTAEAWCSRTGTYRPSFPARLSTGWHRRLLILLSNTPQIMWCCSGSPVLFFAVVPFVVCRQRRVIFLRGAIYNG